MSKISAANNVTISFEDKTWRLYNGRGDEGAPIVEAQPDGLHYQSSFGTARRLSPDGRLPVQNIATVVVGWAVEDSSWHLGVLVTPDVARTRGGRWCALARWDNFQGAQAEQAGAALGLLLNRPFRYVPPAETPAPTYAPTYAPEAPASSYTPSTQTVAWPTTPIETPAPGTMPASVPTYAPPAPPPLMPLPIVVGEWMMQEDLVGLLWIRVQSWRTRTLLYGLFGLGLGLVFAALSLGARFSPYAPVQPDYLPMVGLVIAVVILLVGLWQVLTLLRATTVLIDNHQKIVRVMRGKRSVVVQSPYEGIEYILVSHLINRREKAVPTAPDSPTFDRMMAEAWIHLYSPRRGFIPVCYADHAEGRIRAGLDFDQRRPMALIEIDTPVHHAAAIMSEMMNIPAFVDERS